MYSPTRHDLRSCQPPHRTFPLQGAEQRQRSVDSVPFPKEPVLFRRLEMPDPKSAKRSALPEAAPANAVGAAWVRGAEAWLNVQSEMLASLETLTQDWLQRRREGVAAASQALEHMSECRDPTEIFRIQQDWFTGAVQRASADASAFNSGFAS